MRQLSTEVRRVAEDSSIRVKPEYTLRPGSMIPSGQASQALQALRMSSRVTVRFILLALTVAFTTSQVTIAIGGDDVRPPQPQYCSKRSNLGILRPPRGSRRMIYETGPQSSMAPQAT